MTARPLCVSLDDVAQAMDDCSRDGVDFYLDLHTGQVIAIGVEHLESAEEGADDDDADGAPARALAGWERDEPALARDIVADTDAQHYLRIPEGDGCEAYRLMERFAAHVRDPDVRDRLLSAVSGKGAFRRFKNELCRHPRIRERWFAFEAQEKYASASQWLESVGIRSTWQPHPATAARFAQHAAPDAGAAGAGANC